MCCDVSHSQPGDCDSFPQQMSPFGQVCTQAELCCLPVGHFIKALNEALQVGSWAVGGFLFFSKHNRTTPSGWMNGVRIRER